MTQENNAIVAQGAEVNSDWVTELLPAGTQLSFGAASGCAAGYALRQGGKIAAVLLGGGFMFIQSMAYVGYIEVDWRKFERDYYKLLDRDHDGKVTAKDFQLLLNNTTELLKFNMPAGGGFAAGLTYGFSGSLKLALGASALGCGAATAALGGGIPNDLFSSPPSLEDLTKLPSKLLHLQTGPKVPQQDKFVATLNGRSLEELRHLEWELKNNVTVSAELLGLDAQGNSRAKLLDEIEDMKKQVKAARS
mmetsp:Transcript_15509/g.25388  ORF Transcript_15509/g.25388 Transcript_15509/m.25388 type:complete len:249 (+) Transcript_15509:277-1023(+)